MWGMKRTDDRGAMALIVAIVVPVVLLAIGSIIIDVGSWYAGRAQDQNGADAAVIAVAQSCTPGPCNPAKAAAYAGGSTNGALAAQYKVCGSSATGGLTDCATTGVKENGTACPVQPSGNYVDVMVRPKNSDNTGTITSFFGHGEQGVAACAQAQWGPAGFRGGLAITLSYCQWQTDTSNGSDAAYANLPPWPPWPTVPEHKISLGHIGDATTCTPPQGDSALPGGFGEVEQNGNCTATYDADGWYEQNTGTGNSDQWVHDCAPIIAADQANKTIVEIPVFIDVVQQGNAGEYKLSNLAGFIITGYFFKTGGGGSANSYVPGSPYSNIRSKCSDTCLVGYYVKYTDPGGPPGACDTPPNCNYGVATPPKLTG